MSSKLQVHFFTNPDSIIQTAQQAFGPQSQDVFNCTNNFSFASDTMAYSICKGVVLLVPQTDSIDKVNLILRPYNQPFPGLNVKYFVYRGLKKTDFLNGAILNNTGSDFITKINHDFNAFYANSNQTPPPFSSEFIGYNDTASQEELNKPLHEYFFKQSILDETEPENDGFELPMIDRGKSLGSFSSGECGIDVVLDFGDYKQDFDNSEYSFTVAYARLNKVIINTETDTPQQQKLKKEQTLQFIDIAAFYGLFIKDDQVNITLPSTASKIGLSIYNEVIHKFFTKNNWYIYITSERGRSYNFYNNYNLTTTGNESLKKGNTETTLTPIEYNSLGWPFLIINTVEVTNNLCSQYLQLATDNNVNTIMYGKIGKIKGTKETRFKNANDLIQLPDAEGNYSNITTSIGLETTGVGDKPVASLHQLYFHGKNYQFEVGTITDENNIIQPVYKKANYFDDVFGLIKASSLIQGNINQMTKMVDKRMGLINHYYDRRQQGISAIQSLIVKDSIETGNETTPEVSRITYITETIDLLNNAISVTGGNTADTKTSSGALGNSSGNKTYELPEPYFYSLQLFTDNTKTITGIILKTLDRSIPTKIVLGVTEEENNVIKALITDNTKNPRLFLVDLFEDGSDFISPENIKYQKYKLGVVYEDQENKLKLILPENDILIYSLDRKYHFTKGYSEFVEEKKLNVKYLIDLTL